MGKKKKGGHMEDLRAALVLKLEAFEDEDGVPESVYTDVKRWIESKIGSDAASLFSCRVNATDGRFYFRGEDSRAVDEAEDLLKTTKTPNFRRYFKDSSECPRCKESDIYGGSYDYDGEHLWQPMHCSVCGYEWTDVYSLSRIEDTRGHILASRYPSL